MKVVEINKEITGYNKAHKYLCNYYMILRLLKKDCKRVGYNYNYRTELFTIYNIHVT